MARLYDLMLLTDPTAPEERREAIVGEVEAMLSDGGSIVSTHEWGTRKTTFEIDKRPEAEYRLYQFEGGNELLDRLSYRLKIMDGVLRHRIIRQGPGDPPPPPASEAAQAPREEESDGRVAARAAADAPSD